MIPRCSLVNYGTPVVTKHTNDLRNYLQREKTEAGYFHIFPQQPWLPRMINPCLQSVKENSVRCASCLHKYCEDLRNYPCTRLPSLKETNTAALPESIGPDKRRERLRDKVLREHRMWDHAWARFTRQWKEARCSHITVHECIRSWGQMV